MLTTSHFRIRFEDLIFGIPFRTALYLIYNSIGVLGEHKCYHNLPNVFHFNFNTVTSLNLFLTVPPDHLNSRLYMNILYSQRKMDYLI